MEMGLVVKKSGENHYLFKGPIEVYEEMGWIGRFLATPY